jgi:hypothetical protein
VSEIVLGKIITGDAERDAIHIAVAPVIANSPLYPGREIGIVDAEQMLVDNRMPFVGIVDPFLKECVEKGQKFWMYLYPLSVTGMRHHWSHPAFSVRDPAPMEENAIGSPVDPAVESVRWIQKFAERIDQTYNRLMQAADRYVEDEDWTYDNSETYKDHWQDFPEFWDHWSIATGREKPADSGCPYTCSC